MAIRSTIKSLKLRLQDKKDQGFLVQKLIAATKPNKLAYKILIRKNLTSPQKSQEKWVKDGLEVVEDWSWRSIYLLPRLCTISTKIRNFQFKFLYRCIVTNRNFRHCSLLSVQNRQGNINPSFLGMLSNENLLGKGSIFFVSIHFKPVSHVLNIYECLGSKGGNDNILVSLCLLLTQYYIYCCKFRNISPSIREYVQQLKYDIEI